MAKGTHLFISSLIFLLLPALANATRPFISPEQLIQLTPVIFEGEVIAFKIVKAPTRETYFTYDEDALEVTLKISKSWKENLTGQVKAFTWAIGKAPCTGVEIKKNETYLVYAEWDKPKKNLLFDFCRGFRPLKASYLEDELKILKRLYP